MRSSSAYLRLFEVEAAEPAFGEQQGDDLLDVRPLSVVARVDEHLGPRPEAAADESRRPPVRQVGAVRVLAEKVPVDGPDSEALPFGVGAQCLPVVDALPGDVDRHARADAGQAVDEIAALPRRRA